MVSKKQILEELERVNSRVGQLEQTCQMQAERCDEKIGKLEEQDAQLGQKYGEEICKLEERLGQKCREETSRLEEQADQKYGGGIDKLEAAVFQLEASIAAIRQEISRGEMDQDSKKAAMLYAYRYLLDREPERPEIVEGNQLGWKELRTNFMNSPEYSRAGDWVPSGHFYSPIPDQKDVQKFFTEHQEYPLADLDGIQLNLEHQYQLCADFAKKDMDDFWPADQTEHRRYFINNDFFGVSDAIVYYHMIRTYHTKQIIEIGSGFSSAVALDINEKFYNNEIKCTFIEPYPERLYSLLSEEDKMRENVTIIESRLQDVTLETFKKLEAGDILFVDSTHVSKFGSDVNYILFQIFPCLKKGVLVHFHDIFYPFDYPKDWLVEGRSWNEAYLLHAFLQYNHCFSIEFWMSLLLRMNREKVSFLGKYNDLADYTGSLWLKKR